VTTFCPDRPLVLCALAFAFFFLGLPEAGAQRKRNSKLTPVEISSLVDGAELVVDGKYVGLLPLKEPLLISPGEHTFKITKRGYTDFFATLKVPRRHRGVFVVQADVLPINGILIIETSPPGASVSVDGQYMGETPFDGEVAEGLRRLEVAMEGRQGFVKELTIVAGETYGHRLELKELVQPFYERWLFWASVAAAGGVITAVILTAEGNPPVGSGNPRVVLPLRVSF